MTQGEKYGNQIDTSSLNHGYDSSSKRNGFIALQKHVSTTKKATNASSQDSGKTKNNNWGPFKDRNDFVNMHFC